MSKNVRTFNGRDTFFDKIIIFFVERFMFRRFKKHRNNLVVFSSDYIGLMIQLHGTYEIDALEFIAKVHFDPRKTKHKIALDVGANIGNHSVFFAPFFRDIYSFEPNQQNFDLLTLNSQGFPNVHLNRVALGSACGSVALHAVALNCGGAHIGPMDNIEDSMKIEQVQQTTCDEFLRLSGISPIDVGLVKIDVEGAELSVLQGAKRLLSEHSPLVLFEQLPSEIRSDDTTDSIELLKSYGYRSFTIIEPLHGWRGANLFCRILNVGKLMIVGQKYQMRETDVFERRLYNTIIARKTFAE